MSQRIDLVGEKFGYWNVIGIASSRRYGQTMWLCRCVCGTEKEVNGQTLRKGTTVSCGCQKRRLISEAKIKHGCASKEDSDTPEGRVYSIWRGMIQRCALPWSHNWRYYGARGVRVCDRWMSFQNFVSDMGLPKEGDSIDRIDNNGNYGPDNCRWADRHTQNMNKRPRGSAS